MFIQKYSLLVKLNNRIMTGVYISSHVEVNSFFSFFLNVHLVSIISHPILAKSLNDRSPLQNDSSNYYSILGIPILPFSSSSGSKFFPFSQWNFCARKIISYYRSKKQHRTEDNEQASNKKTIKQLLNRFHLFSTYSIVLFILNMYIFNSNN